MTRAFSTRRIVIAATLLFTAAWAGSCVRAGGQVTSVPPRLHVMLSGDPAAPDFVTAQISAAILRSVGPSLPPGASVDITAILPAPAPLDRGFETSFTVRLDIRPGPNLPPFDASTIVDVDNVDVPGFAPVSLAFRDDPERIVADGVLSRTTIAVGHPTRVYYYHENMRVPRRFCVLLSANDSVRTRVHIVSATAGPNIDVMSVGHAATKTFLARKPTDEGSIVTIAGGRPSLERDTAVGPGEVVVGAVDLSVLDGGPVTMTVLAIPAGRDPADYVFTPQLPADGHERHGNFDLSGFAQWIVAYTTGGPDAAYVYGQRRETLPNVDPGDAGHDYGDYGVLARITFDLANPGDRAQTLYLYEKPLGGAVRSSFLVNGRLAEIGCVRVARRYAIATYALGPRSTAALDVLTMTDGGSNYPLEIGVTATPPEATTPAIRAPDGCFPKPAPPAAAPPAATAIPAPRS